MISHMCIYEHTKINDVSTNYTYVVIPYRPKCLRGYIDGLALFRSLMGKILTDSLLDNLYLLYNEKILKWKILTDSYS